MKDIDVYRNALEVIEKCRDRAIASGRTPDAVTIIAAAKTFPVEHVLPALEAGIRDVGENRVQEAEAKWSDHYIRNAIRLHMIGTLQKNKVKKAINLFDIIHSCSSVELGLRISNYSQDKLFPILLEVNLANEPSKTGFPASELVPAVEQLGQVPNLKLLGLMAIPPYSPDPEQSRPYFAQLRRLSDDLCSRYDFFGPELSMGMSEDYLVAIEEGATMVRIGRAIFGPRS
ncbi:alanine racemase domain protein [Thermobaculum terrenum ATCC BAA-798]|uniref:Pyridoxal phosphate homeostasis protein n=1 Tax=Thermobaculum terrenum (strain ATCC BAA-798 / CCMEE 7001 / YNP1) TaxID=525904 RepID=D1CG00_THET1|nr:YggS family pyridoxal phosphate-dependent enzyme [Thermobaculum terrenum]ACZ41856.1 alanine racemase domain protein [Thermobaculum terrenum ATCC BAA-798]